MNALKVVFKLFLIFFFLVIALVGALGAYSSHKKVNDLKTWQPLSATVISREEKGKMWKMGSDSISLSKRARGQVFPLAFSG